MSRFGRLIGIAKRVAALLALIIYVCTGVAHAIDVKCIEASRYKYLYKIFDDDRAKAAAFFGVKAEQLPPPEACRAVLVTNEIEPLKRGGGDDVDKLLNEIQANKGWLTTLYLASPGGHVNVGLYVGELTRVFWLATHAIESKTFDYVPDFIGTPERSVRERDVPSALRAGWREFVTSSRAAQRVDLTVGQTKASACASACTYIHAAGIERSGRAFFHRPRGSPEEPRADAQKGESLSQLSDSMLRVDAKIARFLRRMDAGEAAVQAHQLTANRKSQPLQLPRSPRYLEDHLTALCMPKAAPEKSSGTSTGMRRENRPATAAQRSGSTSPDVNRCAAAAHTRERLAQYKRFCGEDGCDRYLVYLLIKNQRDAPQQTPARETLPPPSLLAPSGEPRRAVPRPSPGKP